MRSLPKYYLNVKFIFTCFDFRLRKHIVRRFQLSAVKKAVIRRCAAQ